MAPTSVPDDVLVHLRRARDHADRNGIVMVEHLDPDTMMLDEQGHPATSCADAE